MGVSGKIWIYQIHGETENLFLLNHVGGGEMYFREEDTQEEPCNHKGGWFSCAVQLNAMTLLRPLADLTFRLKGQTKQRTCYVEGKCCQAQ